VLTAIWTASATLGLVERVSDRLVRDGMLADRQAPANIRLVLRQKLSGVWEAKGSISVGELWGLYTRYTFMPRLRDRSVLVSGIRAVLELDSWESNGFALATSVDGDRFEGLAIPGTGTGFGEITDATLLVVPERALAQQPPRREAGETGDKAANGRSAGRENRLGGGDAPGTPGKKDLALHFHGLLKIGRERYGKAFKDLQLEILPHLDDPETELEITIEIHARRDSGFSEEKQRIVTENAQVLKFEQADFES
jgi:hypothetical protein